MGEGQIVKIVQQEADITRTLLPTPKLIFLADRIFKENFCTITEADRRRGPDGSPKEHRAAGGLQHSIRRLLSEASEDRQHARRNRSGERGRRPRRASKTDWKIHEQNKQADGLSLQNI